MRVYIADLRHEFQGVLASNCMPLGIGYIKAAMDKRLPFVDSRLFAYPDHLFEALNETKPDVLFLTNYVWNESLSLYFSKLGKSISSKMLVVMGGPNISLEPSRQMDYLKEHSEIDLYVLGEGEIIASDIVEFFSKAHCSLEEFNKVEIPSCVRRLSDHKVIALPIDSRKANLTELPSPWLTGVMDPFFDGRLIPMIETNRGCPFSCTFCVQGESWYSKIKFFEEDRVISEMQYISKKIQSDCPSVTALCIADSNFGMFERDTLISRVIGKMKSEYGWPIHVDATTGKNNSERIIRALEGANGAIEGSQAVQSMNKEVLRNVRRQNIPSDSFKKNQVELLARGLRSRSDLILGLPGETLESHLNALYEIIDSGIGRVNCFQAILLKGSDMETVETREQFKFKTGFRVGQKNFGVYNKIKLVEIQEIILSTSTLSYDEYLMARKHHLAVTLFLNGSWFKELLGFANALQITTSDCIREMLRTMEGSEELSPLLNQYVREIQNETFSSYESCTNYYCDDRGFESLTQGEFGEQPQHRYQTLAFFYYWEEMCSCAFAAVWNLLKQKALIKNLERLEIFWKNFEKYTFYKLSTDGAPENLGRVDSAEFDYDIALWIKQGKPLEVDLFLSAVPFNYEFYREQKSIEVLQASFSLWGIPPRGNKLLSRTPPAVFERTCRSSELL